MIDEEKLVLLPLSDIRGYDTTGMKAGIYITEAQNMDINLMKLALQRIGEDSICIIDGDCKTQVDDIHFAGSNNGMRRASQVFRGEDVYGEITLKNIHRSRIASIAEKINLLAKQQNIPEIQKYINKFSEEFDIFMQATDKWKKGLIDD